MYKRQVDKLSEYSGGVIDRVAFLIDEFDRFVEPLLTGRKDEVDKLMWGLRQVVQMSRKIGLVLAGSGLQRLFTEDYQDPLFGSIEGVELGPFSLQGEREAVKNTFMPPEVRYRLCRDEDFEGLTDHAYALCGGHPWFLSMLGYSAAVACRGRTLNRSLLNHIVGMIISGELKHEAVAIDAGRFYKQSVFELSLIHI